VLQQTGGQRGGSKGEYGIEWVGAWGEESEGCYKGVTRVLQGCHKSVTEL
jgi:hypothetical protein